MTANGRVLTIAIMAIIAVACMVPFFYTKSSAAANSYAFNVSPGTSQQSNDWSVPPNSILTVNASTNDLAVVNITIQGISTMPQYSFYFKNTPSNLPSSCSPGLCLLGSIPAANDTAGETWTVTVTFYHGSGSTETIVAKIFPTITVTPEFPIGSIVAAVAPLAAFGIVLYLLTRKQIRVKPLVFNN